MNLASITARTVVTVAAALTVGAGAVVTMAPAAQSAVTTPCASEDIGPGQKLPCFWNAQKQGNGEGLSFYAFAYNGTACGPEGGINVRYKRVAGQTTPEGYRDCF